MNPLLLSAHFGSGNHHPSTSVFSSRLESEPFLALRALFCFRRHQQWRLELLNTWNLLVCHLTKCPPLVSRFRYTFSKTRGASDSVGQQGGLQILMQCRGVQTHGTPLLFRSSGNQASETESQSRSGCLPDAGKLSKVMSGGMWNITKVPLPTMARRFHLRNS